MLSRVANAIYWMSRYVERAENVARFVDVNLNLALDFPDSPPQWAPLVATTGDNEIFAERYGEASRDNVLSFLTFDLEAPNSIISCLAKARENARSVREIISSEMWEQVNRAYLMVMDAARSRGPFPARCLSCLLRARYLPAPLRQGRDRPRPGPPQDRRPCLRRFSDVPPGPTVSFWSLP